MVLEKLIQQSGWQVFSPRLAENALEMNRIIAARREWDTVNARFGPSPSDNPPPHPSAELRRKVFEDNVNNIDDSALMLAVTDGRDTGVMFEIGYAYRAHVPIVTYSAKNFGSNLMLAQSIIGHVKSVTAVAEVLRIGNPGLSIDSSTDEYGAAIALIESKFKTELALKEGPDEHSRNQ